MTASKIDILALQEENVRKTKEKIEKTTHGTLVETEKTNANKE